MCNGLAVTMHGGDILPSEVTVMPGKGKLTLTGKLGDVMQESAQAAMSYIRSRAESLGLSNDFYEKVDIHIHFPEGAIPKDGPSAGVTMATALASALLRIPVRKDVAMTGEITLRGRVLPIGGLKDKMLAAHRADIFTVIIPKENRKDLKDIPKKVLQGHEDHRGRAHGRGAARGAADRESGDVPARAEPRGRLARGGSRERRRWDARRAADDAGADGARAGAARAALALPAG